MFNWIKDIFRISKRLKEIRELNIKQEEILTEQLYYLKCRVGFLMDLNNIELIDGTNGILVLKDQNGKFTYIQCFEALNYGFNFAYSAGNKQYWYRKKEPK